MGAYADITSLSRFALRFYLRTLYWFRRARPRASKHSLALATWQLLNVFMCACADITYEFSWLDRQKYHFSKKYHFSNRGFVVAFPRALNLLWLSCTQCICGGAGFAVGRRGVELPPPPQNRFFQTGVSDARGHQCRTCFIENSNCARFHWFHKMTPQENRRFFGDGATRKPAVLRW